MFNHTKLNWRDVIFCSGDLNIKLLKFIDFCLGGPLCSVFGLIPRPKIQIPRGKVLKILIIRPGGIGDLVLLIPFIKNVRGAFKNAELDILIESRNKSVLDMAGDLVNNTFCYDNLGFIPLVLSLKNRDYDIVFDTEQWHNLTAVISYFICRKIRIGFDTRPSRSRLYSIPVPYSLNDHEIISFLNLLKGLFPAEEIESIEPPFLKLPKNIAQWAEGYISKGERAVTICISAGVKERRWPAENFQELARYFVKKGYKVLFLGGKKEKKMLRCVTRGISYNGHVLNFIGKISIPHTAALINLSRFYIGLDSGMLHIAFALNVPTISLFGPGVRDKWGPRGEKHIIVSKNLPCSPCTLFGYSPYCNRASCMKEIRVEDVILAVEKIEQYKKA